MFVPSSFSIVCPGVAHAHCLCHAVLQQDQAGTSRCRFFAWAARGTTHPGAGDNASQSGCRFLSEKKKILPGKFPGINMFTVPMHIVRHDPDMSDLLLLCMIEGLCHLLSALFAQELPMRIARVMQSFNKIKQEPRAAGSSHGLQEEQLIQEQVITLLSLGADSCLKRKRFCLESSLGSTCLLFPCTLWGTTQTCLTSFYCAWLRVCAIFFQHQELPMHIARVMQSLNKIKQEHCGLDASQRLQDEQLIQEQLTRLLSLGADSCLERNKILPGKFPGMKLFTVDVFFPCTL